MDGIGFGLDLAVILDPAAAKTPQSRGTYYWGGAFGTWFWIDPSRDLIMIGMIQNVNGSVPGRGTPSLRPIAYPLVYQAIAQ
jgi:CubicO group peptidase (beta-lactamase class C family)